MSILILNYSGWYKKGPVKVSAFTKKMQFDGKYFNVVLYFQNCNTNFQSRDPYLTVYITI